MIIPRSEQPADAIELAPLLAHRLRTYGAATIRGLADYAGTRPDAVAGIVDLFERKGCIERIQPVGRHAPELEFLRWVTERDDACLYQQDLF